MRSVWHSLLWKEWREHRWKLVALTVALLMPLALFVLELRGEGVSDLIGLTFVVLCGYGFLAGMFVGMGLAGKEKGAGTEAFLQMFPVPMWKIALVKLSVASATVTVPIIVYLLFGYWIYCMEFFNLDDTLFQHYVLRDADTPNSYMVGWFLRCFFVAAFATMSLLWWMDAIGANRSDEIRAGAVGFLGIATIWFLIAYLFYLADKHHLPALEEQLPYVASAAPGGPLFWQLYYADGDRLPALDRPWPLFAVLGHATVGLCFICRFGRSRVRTGKGDSRRQAPALPNGLAPPFHTQFGAIAWKQIHETGPLAVFALAAVCAMSAIGYWSGELPGTRFSEIFSGIGAGVTFLVAVVAGIGLYLDDLKPELEYFWRSRPTSLNLWFGVKFLTGMLVLLAVLGIPLLTAVAFYWSGQWKDLLSKQGILAGLFLGWFFFMVYSLAMTAHCLFRQPIYAAITSVLAIWLGSVAFTWAFRDPQWPLVTGTMVVSLIGTIALGWLAVKNDWGWKR